MSTSPNLTKEEGAIAQRFHDALKRDSSRAPDWMVRWDYQRIMKKRKRASLEGVVDDFFAFGGAGDLVKWMGWFREDYPDFIGDEHVASMVGTSRANDDAVLKKLGLAADLSAYEKRVGINNAHDFILPSAIPVPLRNRIRTVLDFGAGYGRQANLWSTQVKDVRYI
ncbi:MAG TPA: hypothetical protein PK760_04120, partial [Flavobacteriales bacterium]|nr:hypothetical protein [Flavobacteriales bacterium]